MTLIKRIFVAALLLVLPLAATAQDAMTEDRVRELVRETILANPEILVEAIAILEERAAQERVTGSADMIAAQREQLEQDPNAPVLANADGDVTIVEFFDYNCPYCRRAAPTIENLVEADPGIRLVYREWPILGEGSVFAARAALASRQQGLYEEFHWAMMDMSGRAEERSVLTIAAEIGLDIDQLRADMEAPEVAEHIETSMRLADLLGITGTPTFILGENLVPGAVEQEVLQRLVDEVREEQAQ
ncbi:DsbA family protein [Alterinioella nitratireducens]|uniref:DsbA family protein n=1 Tax=Alterinioella nitratireducens TaxID=2735915 RepID=UPI001554F6EE|nr:DsbA family protein [Alterinioella nitratireducens]NPD20957.1 DsbA family protein [Alterinioella nitratireducens]